MNAKDFNKLVDDTIARTAELLKVKGGEYAGSEDRFANFKRGSELTGCTPLQVLHIYLSKHYDAFSTYVRDQSNQTERPRSEPISGRLDDIINYCLLAQGLIMEIENERNSLVSKSANPYEHVSQTRAERVDPVDTGIKIVAPGP